MSNDTQTEQAKRMAASEPRERRFSTELFGGLNTDAERVEVEELVGVDILVKDVVFLTNELGEYAVFCFNYPGFDTEYSSACGGMVVVKKLHQAVKAGLLPLIGCIAKHDRYWDIT